MAHNKQVVPWFDKQEWQEVYNYAYSMDPVLQKKAYQQMVLWGSRVPNLSMGVECTQTFLHIRICEAKKRDDGNVTFEDIDLKPIYSTAILRFERSQKTLYQLASMYNIPDWIVNMRHETAHGSRLPSLLLLRDAADCIYDWLNKNYWQKELQRMQDIVIEPKASRVFDKTLVETFMKKSLEVWKCFKLYQLGEYKKTQCVCREELCDAVSELENILNPQVKTFRLKKTFGHTAKHIQKLIFKMLNVEDNMEKNYAEKCLVSQLILNQSFLPPVILQKKLINPFMIILLNIWEDIIIEIQKHGLLLHLLRALLEVTNDLADPRRHIAAYWIRRLVCSLNFKKKSGYNCTKANKVVIDRVLEQHSELLRSHLGPANMHHLIKEAFIKFKVSLTLEPLSYLSKSNMQQLVREAVLTPSENTSLFIAELLDLCEPPLDTSSKHKLYNLVQLYTKEENPLLEEEEWKNDILTLKSLNECLVTNFGNLALLVTESEEVKNKDESESEFENSSVNYLEGNWSVYSGGENWSKCAIGRTPWQNKNSLVTPMLEE